MKTVTETIRSDNASANLNPVLVQDLDAALRDNAAAARAAQEKERAKQETETASGPSGADARVRHGYD